MESRIIKSLSGAIKNLEGEINASVEQELEDSHTELKCENEQLKKRIEQLSIGHKKYLSVMLDQTPLIVQQEVEKAVKRFKDANFAQIEEVKEAITGMNSLIKTINMIIDEKRQNAEINFQSKIGELDNRISDMFTEQVKEFISKKSMGKDVDIFVRQKMTNAISRYKNDKLNDLIKSLYTQVARKYNLNISKTIVKEISGMSLIQQQTLNKCTKVIAEKEKIYLSQIEQSNKPLMLGDDL